MADNLPLIPSKSTECKDVWPVLRQVFRELDFLPPLATEGATQRDVGEHEHHSLPHDNCWLQQYKAECKEISDHEDDIKDQFAQRIAKEPLPNIYKLHQPEGVKETPKWRLEKGLIDRKHLIPNIEQNAGRDGSLWIKNILNNSSSIKSAVNVSNACVPSPAVLSTLDGATVDSYSIGKVRSRPPPPPLSNPPTLVQPQYIVCMPTHLEFVNCDVGNLHTKCLRFFNVSKFECRLSISPTKRRELDIEISSYRGLVVTAGAAVELKVHFRPIDVRVLKDAVTIRVSCGQNIVVPIICYMQPPVLRISIPSIKSSLHLSGSESTTSTSRNITDVIDLGARLLGDVHCCRVYLHCDDQRATFFMLTEDAWDTWNINCVSCDGSVQSGQFVWRPCAWRGGGVARAWAWCRAPHVGVHACGVRVLSHVAVTRTVQLLADVLHYRRDHVVIQAHEKDYDICSEDDPDCEYYVNLGTGFPRRTLTATVLLANKSPILYHYHWKIRPWGVCHCWEEHQQSISSLESSDTGTTDELCIGAAEARRMSRESPDTYKKREETCRLVQVKPERGYILPRSTSSIEVSVPDAGGQVGVQRAVLMLILENIPKASFREDDEPVIVSSRTVDSTQIPGIQSCTREVCDVMIAQLEVWWRVVPVQFVIDPPLHSLYHSRRVNSTKVRVRSWQLYGVDESRVSWVMPEGVKSPPPHLLSTARCVSTIITVPLPSLTDQYPATDILTLVADNDEWKSKCIVTRQCELRHPTLRPNRSFLGVVPPGTNMSTTFRLCNDTYQNIYYWCEVYRWCGDHEPRPVSVGHAPSHRCEELECTCHMIQPRRGALQQGEIVTIHYNVNAPAHDGCVATLLQARRCHEALCAEQAGPGTEEQAGPGTEEQAGPGTEEQAGPGTEARAALVTYRVLAPRLVLTVLSCLGDNTQCSTGCGLDEAVSSSGSGSAVLRPASALVVGGRTCYRVRLTNTSPLLCAVHFDTPIDGTDFLKIKFIPNDINVKPYARVEIRVVVEGLQVCARRVWVYRAVVERAPRPLYLLLDAALTGARVSCELPLDDDFIIITRTQRQANPKEKTKNPLTTDEIFAEEDRKRAFVNENICHCPFDMVYIPPVKTPAPPVNDEECCSPDIVEDPPALSRVCRCARCTRPAGRVPPPSISLQYRGVTLRTDKCGAPAVCVCVSPRGGVVCGGARVCVTVCVRAACWGLYTDQVLIQIDNMEPIVLDVWIEAVGTPLLLKSLTDHQADLPPTLWMSSSDRQRTLRVTNVSCSEISVLAYLTRQYEYKQDVLPFRLYLRFYDVPPVPCHCYTTPDYELGETSELSYNMEMDTGIEIYLAVDCGPQDDTYYKISPMECTIAAGESMKWDIEMNTITHPDIIPDTALLLRLTPTRRYGECWYRPDPAPVLVSVRHALRESRLELDCDDVTVTLCALDLPHDSCLRIRKRFRVQNVGNGILDISATTTSPWCLLQECAEMEDAGSGDMQAIDRKEDINIILPPRSSMELCAEVRVTRREVWPHHEAAPCSPTDRPPTRSSVTIAHFYDHYYVLKSLPLTLDIEYPVIQVEPTTLDFGFVTDGDSRKSYITVSHSSRTNTVRLVTQWVGSNQFEIWPPFLEVPPGGNTRVYVLYTAVWQRGVAEGSVCVSVRSESGPGPAWCRGRATVRASATRDQSWRAPPHDHTDQPQPVPPAARPYLASTSDNHIIN